MTLLLRPVRPRGFTLIELLVVIVIIGVMVALAAAQLMRSPGEAVRDESEHLALLLQAARDEAILQGRVFTFGVARDAYTFMRLDRDGKLKIAKDDTVLRPRRLPPGVVIEGLKIEGTENDGAQPKGVVFQPSGDLPAFRIVLAGGGARWSIVGSPDGSIRTQAGS